MSISKEQIRKALDYAGYDDAPTTEIALIECFRDYVDCGSFRNWDLEDVDGMLQDGELTIKDIYSNMVRVCKPRG